MLIVHTSTAVTSPSLSILFLPCSPSPFLLFCWDNTVEPLYKGTFWIMQWNLYKEDTTGTQLAGLYRGVSLPQRWICTQLCVIGAANSVLIREVSLIVYREVPLYVHIHIPSAFIDSRVRLSEQQPSRVPSAQKVYTDCRGQRSWWSPWQHWQCKSRWRTSGSPEVPTPSLPGG